jgi:hypothetical protein
MLTQDVGHGGDVRLIGPHVHAEGPVGRRLDLGDGRPQLAEIHGGRA